VTPTRPSLPALTAYFLRLGSIGFGGPIALVGYMQRDLVESRHWITEKEYKQGLALAQLAPGPLAAQLAMYLGWVCGGGWGATLIGTAFIAPSFLMVLALSVGYVHFDGLPWMQRVFYGVGAAVIAVIARSAIKLVRMTLGRDRLLWVLFIVSAVVTAWTGTEIVWVFFLCGLVPVLVRTVPKLSTAASVAPLVVAGIAWSSIGPIGTIFWYFAGAGLFVFGSGLAIVPFLHGGVVQNFHWLTERQFLDAVAVSLITPGPVVITVAFIGYLVGGLPGACAAAAGVFLPVYLVTLLLAPSFHRWAQHARIKAFVDGVTAAATGAIAGAVVVLGRRALGDAGAVLIAVATFALLVGVKRVPEPLLILVAGVAGLVLRG
jgi:chromate transporter